MKKKFLSLFFVLFTISVARSQNNGRLFDQPMKLKNIKINIQADPFVATTFIEIEFYNPTDTEIEGLYRFQLDPGQVITGFQLELNGKYRDGSIEERWKARSAYSSIVGKRLDPALLQFEYNNRYRLNIFPVPAKGTRKITMTVQQLLSQGQEELIYSFPLHRRDTVAHFEIDIRANNIHSAAFVKKGLLAGSFFNYDRGKSTLHHILTNLSLNGEISFAIPIDRNRNVLCVKSVEQKHYYALRLPPQASIDFDIRPKKLAVCWDASGSALKRNLEKEINFLEQYISYYDISQLTIIPFNNSALDTAVFYPQNNLRSHWERYLRLLNYDGATQFGCLDISNIDADVVFLFSDGKNSYGRTMPNTGSALVYCINSVTDGNISHLQQIAGSNGGRCIDLNKLTITNAINLSGKVQNWLLRIVSRKGKMTCDQLFPKPSTENSILTGTLSIPDDTLTLYYGHGNVINKTVNFFLVQQNDCAGTGIEKINMLQKFSAIQNIYSWDDALDFGLKEQVVTTNTSYIVLEKVEDYIKYNIAPPKDLEEECQRLNYVKKDTRSLRQKLRELDEFDNLRSVVNGYNEKIRQWDRIADTIQLNRREYESFNITNVQNGNANDNNLIGLSGKTAGVVLGAPGSSASLSEVVVVGYGTDARKNITASVGYVRGNEIFQGLSIEQNLAGRVAGVNVQSSGGYFTNQPQISIRGISSLSNNTPLFVIDGVPVYDNPNAYINSIDIESITVRKDAAATAVYGGRGGNGVIIINSKRPRFYGYPTYSNTPYRLKTMEDVEYMQELKSAPLIKKLSLYEQLRLEHGNEPGFYFDVAQYFFETGLKEHAMSILLNAAEVSDGNDFVLKAIGYTLENWKYFDEAVKLYEQLLRSDPYDLYTCRDLAWACFQNKNPQKAIQVLYDGIRFNLSYREETYRALKAGLLADMNAIIAIEKDKLDISMIPPVLIKPLPVDLRIIVEGNKNDVYNMTVIEPGGSKCSPTKPASKKGGYLSRSGLQYYNSPVEYQIKNAVKGNYRIRVNYYYQYPDRIPSFIKIMSFRNFGKEGQSINVENVIMDNQYGEIEIGEVKWNK